MNIQADGKQLTAHLDAGEAAKLLRGLEGMQEEVGSLASELIAMLRAAGVVAAPEGTIRSEYAGPQ